MDTPVGVDVSAQQSDLPPCVDCIGRNPESLGHLAGRQQPTFAQPLTARLEVVVLSDRPYQHRGKGVPPSASVSTHVEDLCDLAIGVVVQQPVDLGNHLAAGGLPPISGPALKLEFGAG